jgi:hypothetical protein
MQDRQRTQGEVRQRALLVDVGHVITTQCNNKHILVQWITRALSVFEPKAVGSTLAVRKPGL